MKLGFLIIAHSEPAHVARLAKALEPVAAGIHVHVNQKSDIEPFEDALPQSCRLVSDRVAVTWGTCSLWDAVVSATRSALQQGGYDRLMLLSQSCYPLVSAERIADFFLQHPGREFLGAKPMLRQQIGRWRLRFDMLRTNLPRWMHAGWIGSLIRRLAIASPALDWRTALRGKRPYSGTLWWSLTSSAAEHVIHSYDRDATLRDYAHHVFGPEEILPHTLLMNSPYADNVVHHVTYEDWSRRGPSPKWLGIDDVRRLSSPDFRWRDRFGAGTALFARKFGGPDGAAACDFLDSVR